MSKYFINMTNHDAHMWSNDQKEAATNYGEIINVGFPKINPHDSSARVAARATNITKEIIKKYGKNIIVLVQGEMNFTYAVVNLFKKEGVTCLAATSERKVIETTQPDGNTKKTSVFQFVKFREYL